MYRKNILYVFARMILEKVKHKLCSCCPGGMHKLLGVVVEAEVVVVGAASEGGVAQAVAVVLRAEADQRHVCCIKTRKLLLPCCIRLTSCSCYELVTDFWFSGIHCFLVHIIPNFVL